MCSQNNKNLKTVVYAGNDKFVTYICVSILSLVTFNYDLDIWVFCDNVSEKAKCQILNVYDKVKIIDMPCLSELAECKLSTEGKANHSTYCRCFLSELLPIDIERCLWIDGDTLVTGDISDLFTMDLDGYYGAGVLDWSNHCKLINGFKRSDCYYNAGVFVINLRLWREKNIFQSMKFEFARRNGNSIDYDQSYLNSVLYKHIKTLSPKYNMMTYFCYAVSDYEQYLKFSGYKSYEIYNQKTLSKCINDVKVYHFTGLSGPNNISVNIPGSPIWREYYQKIVSTSNDQCRLLCTTKEDVPKVMQIDKCQLLKRIIYRLDIVRVLGVRIRYGYWQRKPLEIR